MDSPLFSLILPAPVFGLRRLRRLFHRRKDAAA
jgi:hypothetical protein